MHNYSQHYSGKRAKQGNKIPGKRDLMTKTSDGAYAFKADDWTRLSRFLVLGADKPTYYAGAAKLTRDNAQVIEKLIVDHTKRVVDTIVGISQAGRAPSNDPALFALAMVCALGTCARRRIALDALLEVARIPTHLFHFVSYAESLGQGWGRAFKRAIGDWYNKKPLDRLAYHAIKYKQRDGWSNRDLLRLSHPKANHSQRDALYRWIVKGELGDDTPEQIYAAVDILTADKAQAVQLIADHKLPHEAVPNELKQTPEVWEALLEYMPLGAMVRNLAKMTAVGLLKPMSKASKTVTRLLGDGAMIQNARLHPMELLKAQRVYAQGHGDKGKLTWQPVSSIIDALDAGFYTAFKNVEPTGKNTGLFIDISGSMAFPGRSEVRSMGNMTARDLAGAMALVTANVEPNWEVFAFSAQDQGLARGYYNPRAPIVMRSAPISPKQRLGDAINTINNMPAGGTDLSLPFRHALESKMEIETFIIYTDNETNSYNQIHPALALKEYRQKTGIDAKLIVCAMVANNISIADPTDSGMLDVEGFDTNAPAVMADFARDTLLEA